MFVSTTVVYEYMKSRSNNANNLFDNTHVRIEIYRAFYSRIIHIANGGRLVIIIVYLNNMKSHKKIESQHKALQNQVEDNTNALFIIYK